MLFRFTKLPNSRNEVYYNSSHILSFCKSLPIHDKQFDYAIYVTNITGREEYHFESIEDRDEAFETLKEIMGYTDV